jgi:non-canonical (house-cleaning) NTP pyrophosphatase
MLTGYYLTSSTDFGVTVKAGIIDSSTQYLNISTYSDCRLHIVSAYAVYYDTG